MLKQRTLKTVIRASGVGLHGGVKVNLTLRPAAPDTCIVFRRVDLPEPKDIPAKAVLIGDTRMCSCLEVDGVKVGPLGAPPPFGFMQFQKKVWFQTWAALL